MTELKKEKATGQGGSSSVVGGQAKSTSQKKTNYCSDDHIKKVVQEIRSAGLQLRSTDGDTQLAMLPKVLKYLGDRGLNTYEGVALGYLRIATRVRDLKDDGWQIGCLREDVVGPDGMWHKGVGRYYLLSESRKTSTLAADAEVGQ